MLKTRLVLADGCFDPIHVGHLDYLEAAAKLGDELIVRVAHDDDIRAKGRQPFQTHLERTALIGALACVSRTSSLSLADAIRTYQPTTFVKGIDWAERLPADVTAACRQAGVTICYVETQSRTSTERLNDGR